MTVFCFFPFYAYRLLWLSYFDDVQANSFQDYNVIVFKRYSKGGKVYEEIPSDNRREGKRQMNDVCY